MQKMQKEMETVKIELVQAGVLKRALKQVNEGAVVHDRSLASLISSFLKNRSF
jgi:hypothetical protein